MYVCTKIFMCFYYLPPIIVNEATRFSQRPKTNPTFLNHFCASFIGAGFDCGSLLMDDTRHSRVYMDNDSRLPQA